MSDSWDISQSSSSASGLFNQLSHSDVSLIEDIVTRIPRDVGSFPLAFRAYEEVMRDRGLDPEKDIVYYRFLLKLSMLRGNWHEKWASIKAEFDQQHTTSSSGSTAPVTVSLVPYGHDESTTPRQQRHSLRMDDAVLSTPLLSSAARYQPMHGTRLYTTQDAKQRLAQLLHQDPTSRERTPRLNKGKEREVEPDIAVSVNARKTTQDEKAADAFRESILIQKCWSIWRAGFLWIRTTGEQVDVARTQLVAHKCLRYWHKSYLRQQSLMERAAQTEEHNLVHRFMRIWMGRSQQRTLQKVKIQEWRTDMRRRMAAVQGARNQRLLATAFVNWRLRSLESMWRHRADFHLLMNVFNTWRRAQSALSNLDSLAAQFTQVRKNWLLSDVLELWRRSSHLNANLRRFEEWTGRRLLHAVFRTWKAQRQEHKRADALRNSLLLSRAFAKWKSAMARTRAQERRAARWSARRDKLLVFVCARAWIARERGQLLLRVRNTRWMQDCFSMWITKLYHYRHLQARGSEFARSHATPLLRGIVGRWRSKLQNSKRKELFGDEYHAAKLSIRAFKVWKEQLAVRRRLAQQADETQTKFLARRFIQQWKDELKKRKLKEAWRTLRRRRLRVSFDRWFDLARVNRVSRVLGERSILRAALSTWVSRVVAIKERELDVQENADQNLQMFAFDRWMGKLTKLQDDASLLENFLLIRKQNQLHKLFLHWEDLTRRRRYLKHAELTVVKSVNLTATYLAWDKWRERFLEQRLQPLERQYRLQMQTNLRFLFFSRWYTRTTTLPAIHFRVMYLKEKTWRKWREAMGPAMQLRKAREIDRRAVLLRAFEKWQAAYKSALRRRASAKRDWVLPSMQGTAFKRRPISIASPFASTSSPFGRFPVQTQRTPPSPSPPPRPRSSIPRRPPSVTEYVEQTPVRPASTIAGSSASRTHVQTTTLFSRPVSRGLPGSAAATSDSDGLWKQLRGFRGARSDSRGGSPAP